MIKWVNILVNGNSWKRQFTPRQVTADCWILLELSGRELCLVVLPQLMAPTLVFLYDLDIASHTSRQKGLVFRYYGSRTKDFTSYTKILK